MLGAITLLATRREDAPALLFEQLAGDRSQARILCNMLGASKERYALAVGIDPGLSIAGMIAATRGVMTRRIAPVRVAKRDAPVNEIVLTGDQIDLTAFPVPKFWPGDGGRYIGTGDITLTSSADSGRLNVGVYRQMLHGPSRSDFIALRASMACSTARDGGRAESRARWSLPTASIRFFSCWARRPSGPLNPSSTSPAG